MLSRVAESLYWTARSIERAENTSRVLHVNFHGLLDADLPDRGKEWRELLLIVGRDDLFREHFPDYTAPAVTEFLLWHPSYPDSVTACFARARENLRGVREQVSSEMWEHLNRLHLLVSRSRPTAVLAAPHDFFVRIREGSQAFQGVMKATLPRGEAYEFLELGRHLERAGATARILTAKVLDLAAAPPDAIAVTRLSALLKACGAFEAFRKQESDQFRPARVVEYLLLDARFPRSVLFCVERCLRAVQEISGSSQRLERAIGRIVAELSYAEVAELELASTEPLLRGALRSVDEAGVEVAAAYFVTRVILPGPYAQAQQQQ